MVEIQYEDSVNFGDALNGFLLDLWDQDYAQTTEGDRVMMIGSIIGRSDENCTVWGAGIGQWDDPVSECNYLAVRGPITGIKTGCGIFGDPALLLPREYNPKVKKVHEIGIVPHWVDYYTAKNHFRDKFIIDVTNPPEQVIREILSCHSIASSSLHGLIVADAYQIPTCWIEFGNKVLGNGLKFYDYYASIGHKIKPTQFFEEIKTEKKPIYLDLDELEKIRPF